MCGVCGTYSPGGVADRGVAAGMHADLVHRGPDETYSLDTPIVSAKLARLGFSGIADGWQPAQDASGRYVALTNGEIYNADQLRTRVGTAGDGNGVDVSVVPEIVARYGVDGLALIDGQFATAILDREANALFLGRDRFGVCPMFWTSRQGQTHFSSELKPLVGAVDRTWRVDLGAIDQYIAMGNVVAPRTLVEGIRAVPPGCVDRFDADGHRTVRYWRYGEFDAEGTAVSDDELRDALRAAVADRLRADVEIGSYLSGGFDSTAIVTEAAQLCAQPVRTFSVVFDDRGLDEGRFQREVARAVGSKHEQIACRPDDIASRFEEMVRHCCYPQRESYNVAAMLLSGSVRDAGLKGVLSGEGADELFFGYDSYAFDALPSTRRIERAENEQAWGRADFGWEVDWPALERRRAEYLSESARERLAGDEFWRTRLVPFSDGEVRDLSPMQMRSVADVHVQMSGHLLGDHGDAMLMRHSVEGRYPFLGNDVVRLAQRVPDDRKMVDFEGKACLRSAYRGTVPESVLRRGKHGFTAYDLPSVVSRSTWDGWRDLADGSGLFAPGCLDLPVPPGKWDFRLSVVSIAMVVDELGLAL